MTRTTARAIATAERALLSQRTVRAAKLLERRQADAELLRHSLFGQMKVLGELIQLHLLVLPASSVAAVSWRRT